jgi:cyanophycin synthetase
MEIDMNVETRCPHCYPTVINHKEYKIYSILDFYFGNFIDFFTRIFFLKKILNTIKQGVFASVLHLSLYFGQAKLIADINRSKFDNSILVFWDAAIKRNLEIFNVQIGGKQTQIFAVKVNNKKYYFDRNPINLFLICHSYKLACQYDNKYHFKKFLRLNNFPHAHGNAFISSQKAFEYGLKLGFPLVVKPLMSSNSVHVSFNIKTKSELEKAIQIAKIVAYQIIVEKYIPGDVYRALILENTLIACTKRQPGLIIGTGKDSIRTLIDEKNKHPWRGRPDQLDCTLHKVEINKELVNWLSQQNLTLKSKLKKDQQIFLSKKINVGNGADLTNVTDIIHSENIKLLERIHQALNVEFSGFDLICEDISIPWNRQHFALIEYNTLPGIGIHHFPSVGQPIDVANTIWDYVLENII